MSTKIAAVFLSCVALFTATGLDAKLQIVAQGDPLGKLVGDWDFRGFVIGGSDGFSGLKCGKVTVAPPTDQAVSVSATCEDASEYSFRLKHGSGTQAYVITVKSKYGISIDDFPVAYVDGQGWHGARDQLVDGDTLSITAMVQPIEGRNWYGWSIQVLPTAAMDLGPLDVKKPYFMAHLVRRK